MQVSRKVADPVVVAPVGYAPPGLRIEAFSRYREVLHRREEDGVQVYHPRVPVGPGTLLLSLEARLAYPFLRRVVDRLHREHRFSLIHAHFIYPDGVIAARLSRRYSIPVITTEQSVWGPAFSRYPAMHRQVLTALPHIRMVTAVSDAVRESFVAACGDSVPIRILPNVVDESSFPAPKHDEPWDPDQILFVGLVRKVKGLDTLVRAMARLREIRPETRLVVIGGTFFPGQERDFDEVKRLVRELHLESHVRFAGHAGPTEVAAAMRRSALLVLPSRREAFPAVILEALASGTPVVATRCGGPEEVVTSEVGRLVPPEDPEALSTAIQEMLEVRPLLDRNVLREYVVSRYGVTAVAARFASIYGEVLEGAGESELASV
ncbi:MAG: glycosyltransferase [Gemmatimonadetes bacterium]|nr:glycosyltransferase [Gemmatimonadota bacterium]